MWVAFRSVEVFPSPKSQLHAVTLPSEVSLNCTVSGAFPSFGANVKLATGAGSTWTAPVTVEALYPYTLLAFSETEYIPATA